MTSEKRGRGEHLARRKWTQRGDPLGLGGSKGGGSQWDEVEQSAGQIRRDRLTRPARSGKNSLCCALLKCASFFILKCASLSHARRARRALEHSGGAGPGTPAHSQVDVDGHVQQRQAVAARAASKRPAESSATGGAVGDSSA